MYSRFDPAAFSQGAGKQEMVTMSEPTAAFERTSLKKTQKVQEDSQEDVDKESASAFSSLIPGARRSFFKHPKGRLGMG
jgi:hypothetical protein